MQIDEGASTQTLGIMELPLHLKKLRSLIASNRSFYLSFDNLNPYCLFKASKDFERYVVRFAMYTNELKDAYFDDMHSSKSKLLKFISACVYVLCPEKDHPEHLVVDTSNFFAVSSRNEMFTPFCLAALQECRKIPQSFNLQVIASKHRPLHEFLKFVEKDVMLFKCKYLQVQILCRLLLKRKLAKLAEFELLDDEDLGYDPSNKLMYFPPYLASLLQDRSWNLFRVQVINPNTTEKERWPYEMYLPRSLLQEEKCPIIIPDEDEGNDSDHMMDSL